MKRVLNDHRDQSSLMRLVTLLIVAGIMGPWAWLSIQAGSMLVFSDSVIQVLTLAIGGKVAQKAFEEFFNSGAPKDIVGSVLKELKHTEKEDKGK